MHKLNLKKCCHSGTRFLGLLPAIHRILLTFDSLKSYFLSEGCENCPNILKSLLENPSMVYLGFIHGTLELLNKTVLKMEANETMVIEMLKYLVDSQICKCKLWTKKNVNGFYDNCLKYIDL